MTSPHRDGADESGGQVSPGEHLAQEHFLTMLGKTGNAATACRSSGLTRQQVTALRESDPAFDRAYGDAMSDAADLLEGEAWRRALEGTIQPVFKAGQPVIDPATNEAVVVRRYSDPLLMMLLRGCKPEKFQMHGRTSMPADPLIGIREIATDHDPPRLQDDAP